MKERYEAAAPPLSSVDNALQLLQILGERRELRVAEAADALGVARSTAHRLLSALRSRGFVTQDRPNAPYRSGPALHQIGLAAIGRIDIRRVARPVLEELRDRTKETASIVLLEGRTVRFVDCVESPLSVRVGSRTGIVWPAHCTGAGKAILAGLSPRELLRRYPDRELPKRTESSITTWQELEAELAEVRARGYATNINESEVGVSAVGARVRDLTGAAVTGIAVAIPNARLPSPDRLHVVGEQVLRAAQDIEALLHAEL